MQTAHSHWRKRLDLPAYQVGEAARYARTTPQTVRNWQKLRGEQGGVLSERESGEALSYLQLIEMGVVAAMRKAGVRLDKIQAARTYLAHEFKAEYPFAKYEFKTNGKALFVEYAHIMGESERDKLLVVSESGQLAWTEILRQRLREFDYDMELATVLRWKVGGEDSPVMVDPRVSFGAPQVNGIPTWVLRERWKSRESLSDIAEDYCLETHLVLSALQFEGIQIDPDRPNVWVH